MILRIFLDSYSVDIDIHQGSTKYFLKMSGIRYSEINIVDTVETIYKIINIHIGLWIHMFGSFNERAQKFQFMYK